MKTTRTAVPPVRANGDAIKKLRLAAKKTQKELIRGSTVQHRTYQRAEEGKSTSRETLAEIARLLNVTFEAVVKDEAEKGRGQVKLYNCAGKGGSQILKLVQGAPGSIHYNFDLDPDPGEAEKIAGVVEFCKLHTRMGRGIIPGVKQEFDAPYLSKMSADFIRAAGELNAKLSEVTKLGVKVFVGSYWYWDTLLEAIEPDVEDEEYIKHPKQCRRVLITFSERDEEFILEDGPRKSELKEACYERAARWNSERNYHPDVIEKRLQKDYVFLELHQRFLAFNREYWNKKKALLT
jgi:transcriptional regulator with XRE-family HTH domain